MSLLAYMSLPNEGNQWKLAYEELYSRSKFDPKIEELLDLAIDNYSLGLLWTKIGDKSLQEDIEISINQLSMQLTDPATRIELYLPLHFRAMLLKYRMNDEEYNVFKDLLESVVDYPQISRIFNDIIRCKIVPSKDAKYFDTFVDASNSGDPIKEEFAKAAFSRFFEQVE